MKAHEVLGPSMVSMDMLLTCCRHTPPIPRGTTVINVCPGYDRLDFEQSLTISLWEILASSGDFPFPDYAGRRRSSMACPTRDQDRIYDAMRIPAGSMNVELVEPEFTRRNSTCCGDAF